MFLKIPAVAAAITFLAAGSPALAAERTILFEAPGIESGAATSVKEERGLTVETLRRRDFNLLRESAMVDYWDAPMSRGFLESIGRVKKLPFFYRLKAKGVRIEFVGQVKKASVAVGTVDYIRARTGLPKECFFFQMRYKKAQFSHVTKLLQGWYCAAAGEALSDDVIRSAIASLGIKGWKAP